MDTKYQDYFNSRISQPSLTEIAVGDSKYRDLQEASNRKIAGLEQLRLQQEEEEKAAKAAYDASVIGKLNLDAEGVVGQSINTAVGVGKTAVDVGAWIAGSPATAWQASQPAISTVADLIPDPISNAYQKLDDALSIRLTNKTAQDLTRIVRDPVGLLNSAGKAAQKVVTPLYDTTVQDRLMGDMGQAYDENDGVLNVAAEMIKTAVSNPVAGAQLFITQLPYMQALAAKGVLGAAAYMGMVSDFTQQSVTKYKESHDGKEPDSAEMAAMLGTSIASVGIEKLESMFLLNKFKGAMPGNKLLTVPAKYGTGGITEFGQETTQNLLVDAGGYQEKLLSDEALLKKSLREAVIAGGMGMASGAVGGAGMKAIQPSEAKLQAAKQSAEVTAAVQASISTGDYTPLTDPKSPTYAPEAAISGLFHTATLEDATPEVKQANFEQASQILSDLKSKAKQLTTLVNAKQLSKEEVAAELTVHEASITNMTAQLADPATSEDKRVKLQTAIDEAKQDKLSLTKRGRVELSKELKDIEAKLATSQQQVEQFNVENTKGIDVTAEVAVVTNKASTPEQIKASVTNLTKMAMVNIDNIDATQLNLLASDSNQDTESRNYFRKLSAARVAENAIKGVKGVNEDVIFGSKNKKGIKYVGTNEYRVNFGIAASANDAVSATKWIEGITAFMNDHEAKAAMATKVRQAAMVVRGDSKQLIKNNGTWELNTGTKLSDKALTENGGLNLHYGSKDLVNGIQAEAKVIRAAVEELQAAFKIQFPKQVIPNVTITPTQQPVSTGTQSPAKTTPIQTSAPVGKTGSSDTGRASDPAGNRTVEASDVVKTTSDQPNQGANHGKVQEAAQAEVLSKTGDVKIPGKKETEVTEEAPASAVNTQEDASTMQVEQPAVGEAIMSTEEQQDGTLAAIQGNVDETVPYRERTLTHYFTQTAGSAKDGSLRPLAAVKDFIKNLDLGKVVVLDYVKQTMDIDALTEAQEGAIQKFVALTKVWSPIIKNNLVRKTNRNFWLKDLLQYFIIENNGSLDLEENIKTAFSVAAFNYVVDEASHGAFNTAEDINRILGRDPTTEVTPEEKEAFKYRKLTSHLTRAALGKQVVQALGMTAKDKNTPINLLPQLESVFGAHVLTLLKDAGFGSTESFTKAQMEQFTGNTLESDEFGDTKFFGLDWENSGTERRPKLALPKESQAIVDAVKGTQSILSKLFSVESAVKDPSLKPIPFTDKTTSRTNEHVPGRLELALEKNQSAEHKLHEGKMFLLDSFEDIEDIYHMAGVRNNEDESAHIDNRMDNKSKNDGLKREWDQFMGFVTGTLDKQKGEHGRFVSFFLKYSPWRQQRVGIDTSSVNPLASKSVRFMIYNPSWETEVDINDKKMFENFQLRVMEGLGEGVDKRPDEGFLKNFEEIFNNDAKEPAVRERAIRLNAAIDAMVDRATTGNALTREQQTDIRNGVEAGKGNFHSLDALYGMVQYRMRSKEGKFKVQMMGELDGVTNGAMLSTLLYGAANGMKEMYERLNKGGMFQLGSKHKDYSVWHGEAGNRDLYENTVVSTFESIKGVIKYNKDGDIRKPAEQERVRNTFKAIYNFSGKLTKKDGTITSKWRNFIKPAINAIFFGSAKYTAALRLSETFMESVRTRIEQANENGKETAEQIRADLNVLMYRSPLPAMTLQEMMEHRFTSAEIKNIQDSFMNSMGVVIQNTLQSEFGTYLYMRDAFNKTANLSHTIYNAVYTAMRQEYVDELIASGEVASYTNETTGVTTQHHDLTKAQEETFAERVAGLVPMLRTAMSKKGNDKKAGILLSDSKTKISDKSVYSSEVTLATKKHWENSKSIIARGIERIFDLPGVSGSSKGLHSFDSATSHETQIEFEGEIFNAHDAVGSGLNRFYELGVAVNKNLWNEAMNYSPIEEMYEMYAGILINLNDMIENGKVSNRVLDSLNIELMLFVRDNYNEDELAELGSPQDLLMKELSNIKSLALNADQMKYATMANMQHMGQYGLEGASYEVTDDNRTDAEARGKALELEVPAATKASADAIGKALSKATAHIPAAPVRGEMFRTKDQVIELLSAYLDGKQLDNKLDKLLSQVLQTLGIESSTVHGATHSISPGDTHRWRIEEIDGIKYKHDRVAERAVIKENDLEVRNKIAELIKEDNAKRKAYAEANNDNWGGIGWSNRNDRVLADKLKLKPVMSGKEALHLVYASMGNNNADVSMGKFYKELTKKLSLLLADTDTLQVVTISKDTDPNSVNGGPSAYIDNAAAWFDPAVNTIYVLGSDYQNADISAKALLHELLHGTLAGVIHAAQNDPKHPATKLVAELEALRVAAKQVVDSNPENAKYSYAVADVNELVSWGLTDKGFQEAVLEKTVLKSKVGGLKLIKGIKVFIDALVDYFFAGQKMTDKQRNQNGMTILIRNTSGLVKAKATGAASTAVGGQRLAVVNVNDFTTAEIHTALNEGKVTQGFTDHLQGLLDGIVTKLHGPFGSMKAFIAQSQASNPIDLWAEAMTTGQTPFASELQALPITMSQQERFVADQVYATMVAAIGSKEGTTRIAYKRLEKLYLETKTRLKPSDFNGGQLEYDAIFNEKSNADGTSNYLARFAAIGLASQQLNRLLHVPTSMKAEKKEDVSAWLQNIFESILEWFAAKFTHTPSGMLANTTLTTLVIQLVNIENKSKQQLNAPRSITDRGMEGIEKGAKVGIDFLKEKAISIASSKYVTGHTNVFVKAAGAGVRMVGNNQVNAVMDTIGKVYDQQFKGKQGIAGELASYVRGALPQYQLLLRALKHIEGLRKSLMTDIAQFSTQAFEKPPSEDESKGLTAVLMRTGAHNLLGEGKFSLMEIANLINVPASLDAAITKYELQIRQFGKLAYYYRNSAEDLAWYKAYGNPKEEFTLKNAYVIANLDGTKLQRYLTNIDIKKAEETIAILTTLYSIEYTSQKHKDNAGRVIAQEMLRDKIKGNGLGYVLLLHKELERKSLEDLFEGNPTQMIHGYTPEIYNPHTEVRVANEQVGKDLELQGFKKGNRVPVSASDPNKEVKHEYVLKGRGLPRRISGMVSTTGLKMKGSPKHNGFVNPFFADGLENAALQNTITQNTQAAIQAKFKPRARKKAGTATKTHLMPVLNDQGVITNWGYQMSEENKDLLLERTSDIGKVLGTMASSIYDKVESKKQNQKVITALHEEWKAGRQANPNAYIAIGPKSADPELREQWNVLPEATKQEIINVWGENKIWVRGSQKNIIFGYQKYELAKMWDKTDRNWAEKLFVDLVELLVEEFAKLYLHKKGQEAKDYARRSAMLIAKGQRGWQEMVQVSKDIIVVKTGIVMVGNIFSNFSQLMMAGVSFQEFVSTSLVASRGAMSYMRDEKELLRYQTMLDSNNVQGNRRAIEAKIVRLKDALARNPVKEMIDAGMMPTIVEDLAAEEDPYSYKTELLETVDEYTSKLPKAVVKAGKTVLMAHDTTLYMGLSRITQLSDFVARYTLYQHNINKKVDPMSKEDAMQESSEAFVNYDIPMPKGFQFMDDMGFMMFTKYFFSIQRQLLKLANDNPARVLMTVALGNFMDLGPTVLEGSFLTRLDNNPLGWGALALPGNVDEGLIINSAMSLIK